MNNKSFYKPYLNSKEYYLLNLKKLIVDKND